MNRLPLAITASCALLAMPMLAAAQTVTFEVIPQGLTAMDMSPDGRWIVGATDQNGDLFPDGTYLYDCLTGVQTILPSQGNDASAVSDDGTIVLGCMPDPGDGVEVAAMWTAATGWQSLGWLPDSLNCPSRSNGYELSADGSVAVGLSWDGCSGRGFRWTAGSGMVELQAMANGGNRASVCSADGSVIGGFAQGSFSRTPAMWDGLTTLGTLLDPPNGDIVGEVQGMSDDGTILLGNWSGDAYRWSSDTGTQIISQGSLSPSWTGYAMDIADNGVIVGFDGLQTNRRAWILPKGSNSLAALNTYVTGHGGTIPPGMALGVGMRISADGGTIVGHTFFQNAWKVTIEFPECPADLDGNNDVGFNDLVALLAAWGTDGAGAEIASPEDVVDFNDLVGLLAAWGPCPS